MLFREMQLQGVKKYVVTMVIVIAACTQLVSLQHGKESHAFVMRTRLELDVLYNALIDMYAK